MILVFLKVYLEQKEVHKSHLCKNNEQYKKFGFFLLTFNQFQSVLASATQYMSFLVFKMPVSLNNCLSSYVSSLHLSKKNPQNCLNSRFCVSMEFI